VDANPVRNYGDNHNIFRERYNVLADKWRTYSYKIQFLVY